MSLRCATVLAAALALVPSGCGGGGDRGTGALVRVTERDFKISLKPKQVRAGDVALRVHNRGPVNHELIVVKAQPALPERSDGMTIDEDALEPVTVGTLEPGAPGATRTLHLHLAPGRYELFCNMSGHFLGGMHTVLVVT